LLKIAQEKPDTLIQLKDIEPFTEKQLNIHGRAIADIICKVLTLPKHKLPRYPYKPSFFPDNTVSAKLKTLKKWREHKADEFKMDPGVLLNNSTIKALAEKNPKTLDELFAIDELKNWQKKEFGAEILAVLKNDDS
jgi:ribonuclease D